MLNFLAKLFLLVCVLSFLTRPTAAQEVVSGKGLACDTADQAREIANSGPSAIERVNAEAGTRACWVVEVLFIRGDTVAKVSSRFGTFEIVEITVVGAITEYGPRPIQPAKQYTLFASSRDKEA